MNILAKLFCVQFSTLSKLIPVFRFLFLADGTFQQVKSLVNIQSTVDSMVFVTEITCLHCHAASVCCAICMRKIVGLS